MSTPLPQTYRTSYHHGDLRIGLIAAVRDLVETKGPDGFSVAEAARRVGVSSAAPYKHFKDRPALLRAVASEGMDRLRAGMAAAAALHPPGSVERVAAIGQAYVDFARAGPGVFRLIFGLTDGHETAPELHDKGQDCFVIVRDACAACLCRAPDDPMVAQRAYMLWTCVHGHSFLTIDRKNSAEVAETSDWELMMQIGQAVLGRQART